MLLQDYFKYTADQWVDLESMDSDEGIILKVETQWGNTFYCKQETGDIIYAHWVVPGNGIRTLQDDELNMGQYYLDSYGRNMEQWIKQ